MSKANVIFSSLSWILGISLISYSIFAICGISYMCAFIGFSILFEYYLSLAIKRK